LIITPAYFEETYQDSIHTKYYELWIGPRIIPSLTFSKITLSLCAGFFFIYDFKETRYNEIKPSIAIKAGYNF
jgi:hypothetical protein